MMYFYSFIAIMIPSLMGGLRQIYVGVDIGTYALPGFYRALASKGFMDFFSNINIFKESGWALVTYISTVIFAHINWNLFFYELISVACFYIGAWRFRNSSPLWLIMLLYFFYCYNGTYNVMRQSIACSIIFMGLSTLEAKHYGKFLLYIIFAASFHASAIICVGYVLLLHLVITSDFFLNCNKLLRQFMFYGSIMMLMFARQFISFTVSNVALLSKYQAYSEITRETVSGAFGVGWERVLLNIGQATLFILYSKGAKRFFATKYKGGIGMYEYLKYVTIFMIAFRFGVGFFDRMILYLEYVNILTLASVHNFIKEKYLRYAVLLAVIGATFLVWWHLNVHKNMVTGWTYPYSSILD